MRSTILKQGNQDRVEYDYKKFKKNVQSPENNENGNIKQSDKELFL